MKFSKVIIVLLLIVICDALMYISYDGFGPSWVTYLSMPLKIIALSLIINIAIKKDWKNLIPQKIFIFFTILLIWNLVSIIWGIFNINDYYDMKFIFDTSLFFLLIPLAMIIGIHLLFTQKIFHTTLKYLFLFGFALIPLGFITNPQLYSRLMIPISIFILISPFLKPKWRILIFIVAATSILTVIAFRTNIIRITASMLLVFVYYLRNFIKTSWLKLTHIILFLAPAILLYFAVTGQFNILNFQEKDKKYEMTDNRGGSRNLFQDNRTFLYAEVLSSLEKNGRLIIGEGAVGKYKSNFYDFGDNRGRYMSEVGFLNTLLFSGIIGVIIFSILMFTISFYALYRSNNWLSKLIGLYIAFRWILFFLEEFTLFDLNFFFYWILIGLISTNEFRLMSDLEVKQMFQKI